MTFLAKDCSNCTSFDLFPGQGLSSTTFDGSSFLHGVSNP
mgnify:CR=1 FL=1